MTRHASVDQRVYIARRYIARLNVEHFRRRFAMETDEATRQRVARLLADEEAKLAALTPPPSGKQESPKS
jgi:hypothetical protein